MATQSTFDLEESSRLFGHPSAVGTEVNIVSLNV